MPPPTAHTPSAADLGGPVVVPVTLVTVPLSNNGAKTAAKPSGTCPITLPSCRASPLLPLCSKGYGLLSHKKFSAGPPVRKTWWPFTLQRLKQASSYFHLAVFL